MTIGVRISTASTSLRRTASNSVSRAMISTGILIPPQYLQKALLKRLVSGLDGVDPAAKLYHRRDKVGNDCRLNTLYRSPSVRPGHLAKPLEQQRTGIVQSV